MCIVLCFFFKQKTAYEMRISDWSSDVCSSDLGWWVQGAISYNLALTQEIDRSKDFETFEMLLDPGTGDTTYNRFGTKSDQRNNSSILARSHQLYAAGSTGFSRTWGEHSLDPLLMYRSADQQSELQSLMRNSYSVFCWITKHT